MTGARKVPSPRFSNTETVLSFVSATTRSGCPSSLKSPTASANPPEPAGYNAFVEKLRGAIDAEADPAEIPNPTSTASPSSQWRGDDGHRRAISKSPLAQQHTHLTTDPFGRPPRPPNYTFV